MNVYKSIAQVMASMSKTSISKDRKNKEQGFSFRGIDDVMNALSVHLAEAGLVILPRVKSRHVSERTTARGTVMFKVAMEVEFDFVAAEDGSTHTVRTWGEAQDTGDKASNKAMSAALKYACLQTFMIPTEGDNDADSHTPDETVKTVKKQPQKQHQPSSGGEDRAMAPPDKSGRLNESALADCRIVLEEAVDMEALIEARKKVYALAYRDAEALEELTKAKDKRKAELSQEATA